MGDGRRVKVICGGRPGGHQPLCSVLCVVWMYFSESQIKSEIKFYGLEREYEEYDAKDHINFCYWINDCVAMSVWKTENQLYCKQHTAFIIVVYHINVSVYVLNE